MRSSGGNRVEHDEEVNLNLRIIKTIPMKVKKSERVRNLKTMLKNKEGISEHVQQISCTDGWLHSDDRLIDHNIKHNSTLNVFVQTSTPIRLMIKIPSRNKTITVEPKLRDNIQNVKTLISASENIPMDDFHLVFSGKPLADDSPVANLNISIQETPTLYLISNPKYHVQISVKMNSKEILRAHFNVLQTVGDIKALVESTSGRCLDGLNLSYNNRKLEDSMTIHHYNIREQSVLEISSEIIQILIESNDNLRGGRTTHYAIEINRYDSLVRDLKDRIFQKLGIPVRNQCLMFAGKWLKDNRVLDSYNIKKNSYIHLKVSGPFNENLIKRIAPQRMEEEEEEDLSTDESEYSSSDDESESFEYYSDDEE